jgi:hypothetical protein
MIYSSEFTSSWYDLRSIFLSHCLAVFALMCVAFCLEFLHPSKEKWWQWIKSTLFFLLSSLKCRWWVMLCLSASLLFVSPLWTWRIGWHHGWSLGNFWMASKCNSLQFGQKHMHDWFLVDILWETVEMELQKCHHQHAAASNMVSCHVVLSLSLSWHCWFYWVCPSIKQRSQTLFHGSFCNTEGLYIFFMWKWLLGLSFVHGTSFLSLVLGPCQSRISIINSIWFIVCSRSD